MIKGKKVKATPVPSFEEPLSTELIGKFIKARRTEQGINTTDAAMLCDVTPYTLNNIENGIEGMRVSSVLKIMNALGIKLKIEPF